MKYILLFVFLSLIIAGCSQDKTQPTPEPQPAPAPQPSKIWGNATPTPQTTPQPEPTPTPTPRPQPDPSAQPIPIINEEWISVFILCPGDYVTVIAEDSFAPIAGAEVIASKDCSNQYTFSTKTNNEGRGVLPELQPGRYCIKAKKIGYLEINKEVILGSGQYSCNIPPTPTPTPQPEPAICRDSDNGTDTRIRGTTTKGEIIRTDTCDGNRILEYYCTDNDLYEISQVCDYGCSDGRCNPESTPTPPPASTCTDSDGGKNYNVKGTVMKGTNEEDRATDVCLTLDPTVLAEFYCDSAGNIRSEEYTCPNSCSDGSCTTGTPTPEPEDICTTNNECGYKKACINGKCESVQCTTSSQCTGCKKWNCCCAFGC